MSEFTFEYRENEAKYETFEWDNLWIDHANDKQTKRVLYIGDSISVETRKELEKRAVDAIAESYKNGEISVHGYLRMIRTVDDDKFGQSWECTNVLLNKPDNYQNGGYWASASGWLFYALAKSDIRFADECIDKFVIHTKKHESKGAPFEFINVTDTYFEGKLAGTCATLPYVGAKRIIDELLTNN